MFRDTTARNRAHQAFGERNYHWLVLLKALPGLLIFGAACVLFGPASVAEWISGAVGFLAESNTRTAVALIVFALIMLAVKARWRRGDYRA